MEFIKISDAAPAIPLPDSSVDFISSQGVLMHTSEPLAVLREMRRVLKIGGSGCIMVYSRPSVWYHLYTAYEHVIINNSFPGLSLEEAFTRNTDGRDCPMSRCFITENFVNMCQSAGFECEYIGGYLTQAEMISIKRYWSRALCDSRLSEEHKDFLRLLEFDKRGLPMIHGRYAGVSGIYQIRRYT